MAFNFKGIGNWVQEKILEPIDDILKGEVGRVKEKVEEGAKSAEASFWETLFAKDTEAKNDVQVAGIPKYVIPLVIASVFIYYVLKK